VFLNPKKSDTKPSFKNNRALNRKYFNPGVDIITKRFPKKYWENT